MCVCECVRYGLLFLGLCIIVMAALLPRVPEVGAIHVCFRLSNGRLDRGAVPHCRVANVLIKERRYNFPYSKHNYSKMTLRNHRSYLACPRSEWLANVNKQI